MTRIVNELVTFLHKSVIDDVIVGIHGRDPITCVRLLCFLMNVKTTNLYKSMPPLPPPP